MTIYTENCNQGIQSGLFASMTLLLHRLHRWVELQRVKTAVQKERDQLLTLSERMLKDIGISYEQALDEARRKDIPGARLPDCF